MNTNNALAPVQSLIGLSADPIQTQLYCRCRSAGARFPLPLTWRGQLDSKVG